MIPKMGGLSIALGFFAVALFIVPLDRQTISVLAASGLVLMLGIYDDVKGSTWRVKLIVSVMATSVLIFFGHLCVRDLGNILGFGNIKLGLLSVPFTYFALFGIINAVNLVDGLDGLLSGISIVTFLSFALLGYMAGNTGAAFLSLVGLCAVIGFVPFNYPRARIFLGDTGSLFIGFLIGAISLMLIADDRIKPVVPPLVLLLPIFDTLRVMGIRNHPFRPDRKHFHHLLLRSGISSLGTVNLMWMASAVFAFFAVAFRNWPSRYLFITESSLMLMMGMVVKNLKGVRIASSKIRRGTGYAMSGNASGNKLGAPYRVTAKAALKNKKSFEVKVQTIRVEKEENT
ncbi:MAG: MraY family glycosyltransferase, partial [Nitrospiraceae bacterium]|nr:MraY family glycosyltransferase [Nitrospiraceae bacterium]